jgi:hypothetical protein
MASTIKLTYQVTATVAETLDAAKVPGAASAAARTLTQANFNRASAQLTGTTTPPVSLAALFSKALAAGVATIDLTALDGTNDLVIDGSGLRVQLLRVRNPATNANPITISIGAANGYDGFGAAFSLTLAPGAEATLYANDSGSDIGATKKNLDLAGTLAQALDVEVVMG